MGITPSSTWGRPIWGLSLLCIGGACMYVSLDALSGYFAGGDIVWGRGVRRMTGEPALMAHAAWLVVGAAMVAEGIRHLLFRGAIER
jgi:hypothetical protein